MSYILLESKYCGIIIVRGLSMFLCNQNCPDSLEVISSVHEASLVYSFNCS